MYAFLKLIMRTLVRVYLAGCWRLVGGEQMPAGGPVLVCSNHIGTIDPPLVPAFLPRPDTWSVGKKEWWRSPFTARLFGWYHAFPIERHSADRAALRRMTQVLREGHALVIYPEGTRINEGGMRRPEPGAGFLAVLTGAPVLPVALAGTREVLPRKKYWPRRHRTVMTLGRPFHISPKQPDGARTDYQAAADAIMLAVAELLPPELRGEFADLEAWRERVGGLRIYADEG